MELEKLPMPINPRAACGQNGRRADKSTKRQRAKPVDLQAGSCQNYTDSQGSEQKRLCVFSIFTGSFNSSTWSSLNGTLRYSSPRRRKQS